MPRPSTRLANLPPYIFSTIADRIRTMSADGADIVRFDIGNPDMPPSPHIIDALAKSAATPSTHGYTGYRGLAAFREAVAQHYKSKFGVQLDPVKNVLPLIGSKEGIVNISLAYLSPGDVALIPDIGYPAYAMGTQLAEADIQWVKLQPDNNFLPDLSSIPEEALERAKVMWINYPNNPTGTVATLQDYETISAFCDKHGILLLSDNPYVDVTFDGFEAPSALKAAKSLDNIIEFFSFSKSYNMAGWRLGAAVGSAEAITNLLNIKSNMDSGHFQPIYEAGIAALQTPQLWIDERNQVYQRRRDFIMDELSAIGLSAQKSAGSLYVWAKPLDMSAIDYVEQALIKAQVSTAPGEAYGPGGKDYIRMSVAIPDERIQDALERLSRWYNNR